MQEENDQYLYLNALHDFRNARRKATLRRWLADLRHQPDELLSYEAVRSRLRATESPRRELEEIPLDQIVGSVNRATDFSRSFLPLNESDQRRWARVRMRVDSMQGLPPIEAYRLGGLYFILDGHHRVSVAREIGARTIQGYVTPVLSRVALAPGDKPDDLIIKAEYTDFLAETQIDERRPQADLLVTTAGQYPRLAEQVRVHQYFLGVERGEPVGRADAAQDWYDSVYLPVVTLIRERKLLAGFPGRTETDLYLWIMEHREALGDRVLGWEAPVEKVISELEERYSAAPEKRRKRALRALLKSVTPAILRNGPQPGAWRAEIDRRHDDRLFGDILVTLPDTAAPEITQTGAAALALEIARREGARLTALHIPALPEPKNQALVDQFYRASAEARVHGRVIVETGPAASVICKHARWFDLTVFRLAHPPPEQISSRLRSGVRQLIRCAAGPLLAVSDTDRPVQLDSALLAFGPGAAAREALYVAAYLAGRWQIPLTVVSVKPGGKSPHPAPLEQARAYLETNGIAATYIEEQAVDTAAALLLAAERVDAGFFITGSYEATPLLESVQGSTVDQILRSTRRPVLICR